MQRDIFPCFEFQDKSVLRGPIAVEFLMKTEKGAHEQIQRLFFPFQNQQIALFLKRGSIVVMNGDFILERHQ